MSVKIPKLEPGESVELKIKVQRIEVNPDRRWWQIWKPLFISRDLTEEEAAGIQKELDERANTKPKSKLAQRKVK